MQFKNLLWPYSDFRFGSDVYYSVCSDGRFGVLFVVSSSFYKASNLLDNTRIHRSRPAQDRNFNGGSHY